MSASRVRSIVSGRAGDYFAVDNVDGRATIVFLPDRPRKRWAVQWERGNQVYPAGMFERQSGIVLVSRDDLLSFANEDGAMMWSRTFKDFAGNTAFAAGPMSGAVVAYGGVIARLGSDGPRGKSST